MFYHARSNKHVQEGVAFELLQAVTIEVPAVMAPDPNWLPNPEDPDEVAPLIEISPATTREEDQMMQYPANWLNMTTAEEKQAAGLGRSWISYPARTTVRRPQSGRRS
jgi:hypothetical protein